MAQAREAGRAAWWAGHHSHTRAAARHESIAWLPAHHTAPARCRRHSPHRHSRHAPAQGCARPGGGAQLLPPGHRSRIHGHGPARRPAGPAAPTAAAQTAASRSAWRWCSAGHGNPATPPAHAAAPGRPQLRPRPAAAPRQGGSGGRRGGCAPASPAGRAPGHAWLHPACLLPPCRPAGQCLDLPGRRESAEEGQVGGRACKLATEQVGRRQGCAGCAPVTTSCRLLPSKTQSTQTAGHVPPLTD